MKIVCYTFNYKQTDIVKSLNNIVTYDNAIIKFPTNFLDPVIRIDLGEGNVTLPTYTYAYIEEFGQRFYFIQNIIAFNNRIFDLYLHVDVLYTYIGKPNAILRNETVFVERSSNSSIYNLWYEDNRISYINENYVNYYTPTNLVVNDFAVTSVKYKELFSNESIPSNRCILLTVSCSSVYSNVDYDYNTTNVMNSASFNDIFTNKQLGVISYILTKDQARQLLDELLSSNEKASFIRTIKVLPYCFDCDTLESDGIMVKISDQGRIFYGNGQSFILSTPQITYTSQDVVWAIKGTAYYNFSKISLSAYQPHSYLTNERYTKLEIYLPYVGWKQIDLNSIIGKEYLYVKLLVNYETGNASYQILLDSILYESISVELGLNIPVNSSNEYENEQRRNAIKSQFISSQIASAVMFLGGVALSETGYGVPMMLGAVASSTSSVGTYISQGLQIFDYGTKTLGSSNDSLYLYDVCMFRVTQKGLAQSTSGAWLNENGRPTNINQTMRDLIGYNEIGKCDFSIGNTKEENELISLLKGGVHFPTTSGW